MGAEECKLILTGASDDLFAHLKVYVPTRRNLCYVSEMQHRCLLQSCVNEAGLDIALGEKYLSL